MSSRKLVRRHVASVAALVGALSSRSAHAQIPSYGGLPSTVDPGARSCACDLSANSQGRDVDWSNYAGSVETFATWLPNGVPLKNEAAASPAMAFAGIGGDLLAFRFGAGRVGWLPVRFGLAVGSYPRVAANFDGTLVEQRPWTTKLLELPPAILPSDFRGDISLGKDTTLELGVRYGFALAWSDVSISEPRVESGTATTFFLRAMAGACHTLDVDGEPARLCASAEANFFEYRGANGGSLAVGFEL